LGENEGGMEAAREMVFVEVMSLGGCGPLDGYKSPAPMWEIKRYIVSLYGEWGMFSIHLFDK